MVRLDQGGRGGWRCVDCGQQFADWPPDTEPCSPLREAINRMGIGLHAARLELPATVADDLTQRWRDLLDAIERVTDVIATVSADACCGEVVAKCVCGLPPGHDGAHHCLRSTVFGTVCDGQWESDPFHTVRLPGGVFG